MKKPPVKTWSEPIDGVMIAGIASCYVVRHGCVYGHSTFVMVDIDKTDTRWSVRSRAREMASAALEYEIVKDHGGRLPFVGALREFGGEVDLSW